MLLKKAAEAERNQDATIYIGNLDEQVDETILYELFIQVAPIRNINIPKDRITQTHQGYGFVEFKNSGDSEYAENIMNGIKLFGKTIRVKKTGPVGGVGTTATAGPGGNGAALSDLVESSKIVDVGANLFIGNLDELIDENFLASTFSRFGQLVKFPYIAKDDNGASKGYAFLSYADFESSDKAINEMDGQYLMNKVVKVNYAYKKVGASRKTKGRERHGDEAERLLAQQAKKNHYSIVGSVGSGVNEHKNVTNRHSNGSRGVLQPSQQYGNIRVGNLRY